MYRLPLTAQRRQPEEEPPAWWTSPYSDELPIEFTTVRFTMSDASPPPSRPWSDLPSASASASPSSQPPSSKLPHDPPSTTATSGEERSRTHSPTVPAKRAALYISYPNPLPHSPYIAKEAHALKQARNRVYALIDASEDAAFRLVDQKSREGNGRNTRATAKRKRAAAGVPTEKEVKSSEKYDLAYGYGEKDEGIELFEELEKEEVELQKLWVEGPVTTGAIAGYMRAKKKLLDVISLVYQWEETKAKLALEAGPSSAKSPSASGEPEETSSTEAPAKAELAGPSSLHLEPAEFVKPTPPPPDRRRSRRGQAKSATPIDMSRESSVAPSNRPSTRSRSRLNLADETPATSPSKTLVAALTASHFASEGTPSSLGKRRGSSHDLRPSAPGSERNTPMSIGELMNPSPVKSSKATGRRKPRGTASPRTVKTPSGSAMPSPNMAASLSTLPASGDEAPDAGAAPGTEEVPVNDGQPITRLRSRGQIVLPSRFDDYVPAKKPRICHDST